MSAVGCIALAMALFGTVPAAVPDSPVTVTRAQVSKWTALQKRRALACADKYGIRYVIVER